MKSIEHAQRQEAMDHNEAVRMHAAELSPVLREEYEEHFFVCVACALEVKAAAAFVDNARTGLRQPAE